MDKGFVTPQIQTANSKRLLPADTVGREKAHTHSHRPAFLLQGHTACNCCDFSIIRAVCWCRGESRGHILHAAVSGWPSRLSPRAHCDHSAQAAQTQRHFSHAGHGPRSPPPPHQGAKRCCITAPLLGQGRELPAVWGNAKSGLISSPLPS